MNDTHPKLDSNMNDKVLSIAPSEGKVPVDLLYDYDWRFSLTSTTLMVKMVSTKKTGL